MRPAGFHFTTWFCVALLATISLLGEGMHFLPGCGHCAAMPGGSLWFGTSPARDFLAVDDNACGFEIPQGNGSPTLSTDECAICTLLATAKHLGSLVVCVPTSTAVDAIGIIKQRIAPTYTCSSFRIRAPPFA